MPDDVETFRALAGLSGPPGPPPSRIVLSVRDFGAACDQETDDTEAVRAAIQVAAAVGTPERPAQVDLGEGRSRRGPRVVPPIEIPPGVVVRGGWLTRRDSVVPPLGEGGQ